MTNKQNTFLPFKEKQPQIWTVHLPWTHQNHSFCQAALGPAQKVVTVPSAHDTDVRGVSHEKYV